MGIKYIYSIKQANLYFWLLISTLIFVFLGTMVSVFSSKVPFLDVARFGLTWFGLYTIISSFPLISKNKSHILSLLVFFIIFSTIPTLSSQMRFNSFANGLLSYTDSILWVVVFFMSYKLGYSKFDIIDNLKKIAWLVPIFFIAFLKVKNYFSITTTDDAAMISTAYYSLFMLPFVVMIEKKWQQWFLMFLVFLTILLSVKRTGLLVFILCFCAYYYYNYVSNASIYKKIGYLIFSIFLFFSLFFLFNILVESLNIGIVDRMMNMKEDGGSGRDIVWVHTISMIGNSDILDLLFGHGFNMVVHDSRLELSAHCDYLEIIYDYGIVGSFIYLLFYLKLFGYYRFIKRYHPEWRIPFILSFILVFSFSLTSHLIIYPTYFLFLCILWGLMVGHCDNKKFYIHG